MRWVSEVLAECMQRPSRCLHLSLFIVCPAPQQPPVPSTTPLTPCRRRYYPPLRQQNKNDIHDPPVLLLGLCQLLLNSEALEPGLFVGGVEVGRWRVGCG